MTKVFIVGAGPGDPGLLTVKALKAIESAGAVVYDRLIAQGILDLIPETALKFYAGKSAKNHNMPQGEINKLLLDLASDCGLANVVRLKGGDPFIFGRGGEEAEFLASHNISFEVIPGITAASACAASALLPLTHRDLSSSVTLVTGHGSNDSPPEISWNGQGTLVIYMGLANLEIITKKLAEQGVSLSTPAAIIENGTLPEERVFTAAMKDLPEIALKEKISSPALVIIGNVAGVRIKLSRS